MRVKINLIVRCILLVFLVTLTGCYYFNTLHEGVLINTVTNENAQSPTEISGVWSLAELTHIAEVIVVGKIVRIQSFYTDDDGWIVTDVQIQVEKTLKGIAPQQLAVRTLGGEVDNVVLKVTHEPHFSYGERAVLFLNLCSDVLSPLAGAFVTVGGFKGKLTLKDGRVAEMFPLTEPELLDIIQRLLKGEDIGKEPQFIPQDDPFVPNASGGVSPLSPYSYSDWRWPASAPRVQYYINPSGIVSSQQSLVISAINAASTAWNNVGSKFIFSYEGTTSRVARQDGYNIVEMRYNYGATGWPAKTSIWAYKKGSSNCYYYDVFECDMIFNLYYKWAIGSVSGYFDVQNIATHEFGHFLVLNDLYRPSSCEATMYGYASTGETKKRSLEYEDKQGMLDIYGYR